MDIFQGEEIYAKNLVFKETSPINDAFNFFGIGDKNMVYNSGSYFLIQISIFVWVLFKFLINCLARVLYKWHYARKTGMYVYEDNYVRAFN